jgi:hypothetical protein
MPPQSPSGTRDREAFLVQQLSNLEKQLDVSGAIGALPRFAFRGRKIREFTFPVTQDMSLHSQNLANLSYLVIQLRWCELHNGPREPSRSLRRFESDRLPAGNDDWIPCMRVHALSFFAVDNPKAAESAEEYLFSPGKSLLDYVENLLHHLLRVRVRHASVRIINSFGQVILIQGRSVGKAQFNDSLPQILSTVPIVVRECGAVNPQ